MPRPSSSRERRLADREHVAVDAGVAERRRPGDLAGRVQLGQGSRPGRVGQGQRRQVRGLGPHHHIERQRDVAGTARHRPPRRQQRPVGWVGPTARHPPHRRLEPGQTRDGGGDADRPAAVGAGGERHEAGGEGCGRAAGRAARRPVERPRVGGGPERLVDGVGLPAELGRVGLAHHHAPGGPQPLDQRRVDGGGSVAGEGGGAAAGREPDRILEVLHRQRHTGEGADVLARGDALVDGRGLGKGRVGVDARRTRRGRRRAGRCGRARPRSPPGRTVAGR